MQTQTRSPSFPAEFTVTEIDALGYSRGCMIGTGLLIGGYGAAIAHLMPPWALPLIVLLVLPRWMINVHELLHIYDEQQLNRFICLMGVSPVPLSVVSLSYGEIRAQHFAHHAAPTTDQDPDLYHIQGNWLQAVFNAFTSPEQSAFRWIATHGLTSQLAFDLAVKLLVLTGLVWVGGSLFLWFWLPLRLVYGLGDLAFFRLVHHHQGDYGNFQLHWPQPLMTLGAICFGSTVVQTTFNHDIHHENPYIAARSLRAARACRNPTSANL
jgi:fatty acid desaturase